ncbi:MAG: RNA-binding S4 domain-containing protein [Prolixibacteraceae bacterium]|nr:RNA-binding S4 domain-containing protein [Prolixibacteraceae bacterium]MBN2775610.1 RNA-binding S4 domain-containing protein [Prolixibacteraceae bacterium]
MDFKLKSEYIELISLLKVTGISETGGQAKLLVEEGQVFLNGKLEFRKRAKLRRGDIVKVFGQKISIL